MFFLHAVSIKCELQLFSAVLDPGPVKYFMYLSAASWSMQKKYFQSGP